MIKNQLSDEELFALIDAGSKSAEDAIYERYIGYSKIVAASFAKLFKDNGISFEEFEALAISVIPDALACRDKVERNFYLYWKSCVKNAFFSYIRENAFTLGRNYLLRSEADDLLEEVQLDGNFDNKSEDLHALFGSELREKILAILNNKANHFSRDEIKLGKLIYLEDYSQIEASEKLKWNKNRVSYVYRSLKAKITDKIKDCYL